MINYFHWMPPKNNSTSTHRTSTSRSVLDSFPVVTRYYGKNAGKDLVLPTAPRSRAHCFMAMPPQFNDPRTLKIRLHDTVQTLDIGKSDPSRKDRQLRFEPGRCPMNHSVTNASYDSAGTLFVVHVPNPRYILLDCGYKNGCAAGDLQVFLDGWGILANTESVDNLQGFYFWIHKVDLSDMKTHVHRIHVCGKIAGAHFSRIVVIG